MLPGDPGSFSKRKHRGANPWGSRADQPKRGHGTLPHAPDLTSRERRDADIEHLSQVQASRPLKPPRRKQP